MKRICKDAFSVAGAVQETCLSELGGGKGVISWYQILRFAKIILRDRYSTSYDLVSLFPGRYNTFDRWIRKIAKYIGTRPSGLHFFSIFERNLAELLRFGCCQAQKLGKSRRAASFWILTTLKNKEVLPNGSFLILSNSNIKEISQNNFVFKLTNKQVDRQTN